MRSASNLSMPDPSPSSSAPTPLPPSKLTPSTIGAGAGGPSRTSRDEVSAEARLIPDGKHTLNCGEKRRRRSSTARTKRRRERASVKKYQTCFDLVALLQWGHCITRVVTWAPITPPHAACVTSLCPCAAPPPPVHSRRSASTYAGTSNHSRLPS